MPKVKGHRVRRLAALVLGWVVLCSATSAVASQDPAQPSGGDRLVVSQVSRSPEWSAGEGWVVADARNPSVLAALWTDVPYTSPAAAITAPPGPHPIQCGLGYSSDGGKTWVESTLPYQAVGLPLNAGGCADPTLVAAPDGTLYTVFNGGSAIPGVGTSTPRLASLATLSSSKDGGRTWTPPTKVWSVENTIENTADSGSPDLAFDRPWLTIDPRNAAMYVSLSDDALVQRVVLASHDRGVTWGTAYPLDPNGQTIWGDQISAANGILAAAYAFNPDSVAHLASPSPAVTCRQVCAVFETSTDDGRTWARRVMPVEGAPSGLTLPTQPGLGVAADPSRAGRFAVLVPKTSSIEVWITPDRGESWMRALTVNALGGDTLSHPWVAFGSTGALGVVWRNTHSGGSYNVHAAVSRDGGTAFSPSVNLTPGTAPVNASPDSPGDDCACNLHLDGKYLYTTWGDSRTGQRQIWIARYDYSLAASQAPARAPLSNVAPQTRLPVTGGAGLHLMGSVLLVAAGLGWLIRGALASQKQREAVERT